jgi:bacillithiol system protein YtxJ
MHPRLHLLEQIHQIEEAIADSATRPVVFFKHSRTCGTSAQAFDELQEHLDTSSADARYEMVIVQSHRDLSNLLASRFGVRHETPQVILVRDRKAVWHASHFHVTAATLEAALAASPESAG